MIDIRDVSGSLIVSVPVTEDCEHVSELMVSDYVSLSYVSLTAAILPVGAYVIFNGVTYRLLSPYKPIRVSEVEYRYEPQFHSKVIAWSGRPFFFLQKVAGVVTGRETDWTLTDILPNFLEAIVDSLLDELAETYTYAWDAGLTGTKSLSFQATSIFDALNEIANAWETEWYLNGSVITFGKCAHGTAVTLTVGTEVSVPEITASNAGYYSRFYAFGSSRNIDQEYDSGSTTNHVVQKRLALPVATCPLGYKDIQAGLPAAQVFSKVLIFDDIYPSSNLAIVAVRAELRFAFDGEGNKIQIGVDEFDEPIFERYSIFFFRINGFNFSEDLIVSGKTLSVHFASGNLIGREFELGYESATTEYEIIFDESSGYIIPNAVLLPADGDSVILFNILMPQVYVDAAEATLEDAVDAEIAKQGLDMNTYRVNSFPVRFTDLGISLSIGRNVSFVNGASTLNSRVLSITEKLDFPVQQVIQIGEKKAFRTTQQLKEAVTNINKNVGVIEALNDLSTTIQNAYGRTQKQIAAALAQWNYMWYFDKTADLTPDQTNFPVWKVRSNFDLFINGEIQATEDITSWIAEAVLTEVLANLVASSPLRKDTASSIRLDYDSSQFELGIEGLTIKAGILTPSEHDHIIADVTGLQTTLDGKLATTLKGALSGLAELDATGRVPAAQLPAVTSSLELGETISTAYRGDRGKTAYDHSQLTASNPHQTTFALLVGKPTTLAGYGITDSISLSGHTHLWANITDKPTTFAPATHAHAWADITSGVPSYSLSTHNHTGTYEPAINKTTGYLRYTGAVWEFKNETYLTGITKAQVEAVLTGAITSHTHAYIATSHTANSIINGTGFLKNNGTGTWSWDASTYSVSTHTHTHNSLTTLQGGAVSEYYHLSANLFNIFEYVANSGNPYLRLKLPVACDYEVQAWSDFSQFPPTIWASLPPATTTTLGGIMLGLGATKFLREDGTWQTISAGSMVYPGAGIALSTGSAWGASITNNSANWNTAYTHSTSAHQAVINGTGFVKASGTTISFDNSTYLTGITKAQIEAQLTGAITTHTHAYAALSATINAQTTNYTIVAGDNNKIIECTGTFTVTLPANMEVGMQVTIVNVGTGVISIAATASVFSKASHRKLASQWIGATAYHRGSSYWVLMGDLTA